MLFWSVLYVGSGFRYWNDDYNKALFHIWVAPRLFRCSLGTFSKKPSRVGRLKQLRFSVGILQTQRFCVGNIKTKTSFCDSVTFKFFCNLETNETFCGLHLNPVVFCRWPYWLSFLLFWFESRRKGGGGIHFHCHNGTLSYGVVSCKSSRSAPEMSDTGLWLEVLGFGCGAM